MKVGSAWVKHCNKKEKCKFVVRYDENISVSNFGKKSFLFDFFKKDQNKKRKK